MPTVKPLTPPEVLERLERWQRDLELIVLQRRGRGLGAEPKTFDLLDSVRTLQAAAGIVRHYVGD